MGAYPAQAIISTSQSKLIISGATPKAKSLLMSALLSLCTYYSTFGAGCQGVFYIFFDFVHLNYRKSEVVSISP